MPDRRGLLSRHKHQKKPPPNVPPVRQEEREALDPSDDAGAQPFCSGFARGACGVRWATAVKGMKAILARRKRGRTRLTMCAREPGRIRAEPLSRSIGRESALAASRAGQAQ